MEKTYNFRHLDWNIFKLLFRCRFADFSRLCRLQRVLICGKMIVRKLLHCLVLPMVIPQNAIRIAAVVLTCVCCHIHPDWVIWRRHLNGVQITQITFNSWPESSKWKINTHGIYIISIPILVYTSSISHHLSDILILLNIPASPLYP